PFINNVERIDVDHGKGLALKIDKADGTTDWIAYNPDGTLFQIRGVRTRANLAVNTSNGEIDVRRWFRADETNPDLINLARTDPSRPFVGKVIDTLPMQSGVVVTLAPSAQFDPQSLVGKVVFFQNDRHRTAHTIAAARGAGGTYELTFADDVLVGLAKVD